jgi:hypothetical protein
VIQLLQACHRLTDRQKSLEPESVRKYHKEWIYLYLQNDVLYRKRTSNGYPVVTRSFQFQDVVFTGLHDEAGHLGCARTVAHVRSRFFWPQLEQSIDYRIRHCPRCNCRKTLDNHSAKLVPIYFSYRMD